ncbi:S24/S26 family peptidase [Qipengyuania sp. S6317L1]|uniref:S24/S26 family peptidase n=1 Tax=Qipengyuania sp. S6317L1 TaxID=2926410 RepID=UPI001FF491D8|nr:S24/S26 family peptidase [Qipengyuania sp. S6317L1]
MIGYKIARVRDKSMEPRLPKGSVVLFSAKKRPKRGDTVLAMHPEIGKVVQKVTAVGRKGGVYLSVDKAKGHEAQSVGRVPIEAVLGVMIRRLA